MANLTPNNVFQRLPDHEVTAELLRRRLSGDGNTWDRRMRLYKHLISIDGGTQQVTPEKKTISPSDKHDSASATKELPKEKALVPWAPAQESKREFPPRRMQQSVSSASSGLASEKALVPWVPAQVSKREFPPRRMQQSVSSASSALASQAEALLKLAMEQHASIRRVSDKAAFANLRQSLSSLRKLQQEIANQCQLKATEPLAKADIKSNAPTALLTNRLCLGLSGDVLFVANGNSCVAACSKQLSNASPVLKALLEEHDCKPEGEEQHQCKIELQSFLFSDGRRLPLSAVTLVLVALATEGLSASALPIADISVLAEALSLAEHWKLPDVCQRLRREVRARRINAGVSPDQALEVLQAARAQIQKSASSESTNRAWEDIAATALDELVSLLPNEMSNQILAKMDVVTLADILNQDSQPHEIRLSGFPKNELATDLMDGVYIRIAELHEGHPVWKRVDAKLDFGVLFIYYNRGKWKISSELGGRLACAILRCEVIPMTQDIKGPFWETVGHKKWEERPEVKMQGTTLPGARKQGATLFDWPARNYKLAWEWLASKVTFSVDTPLAALRALEEGGYCGTELERRLLKNAAEENPFGQNAEWDMLSTDLLQRLLAQDALHTSCGDELEVLRAVLDFIKVRPSALKSLLASVRLPFVRISRLRAELAPEDMKILQECDAWSGMFEEAMAVQLGKRKGDDNIENPRMRKRTCCAGLPQLSPAEVVAMCNISGS
jgi:hypothetical protein